MIIDSYVHVGNPRYGSLRIVKNYTDRLNISRKVLALGPDMPDFTSLITERDQAPEQTRIMGIPFGQTREQREDLTQWQIGEGIDGFRLMPFEVELNLKSLEMLGEAGLWLYAINPQESPEYTAYLLEWLETYPEGHIASPHFLQPRRLDECSQDPTLLRRLLNHPRYNVILSRFGGVGSGQPYPHGDLIPWVKDLIEIMGWEKLLFGGEMPIFYQRSELPEQVRDWIKHLDLGASEGDLALYYGKNAQRLLFKKPSRPGKGLPCPSWVEEQTDRKVPVYIFPHNRLFLPMEDYETLIFDYQRQSEKNNLTFAEYTERILSLRAEEIRKKRN